MQALGGGEKLSLVLAEHLSYKHNVSLFSMQTLDCKFLQEFFNVDLSRVKFVSLRPMGLVSRGLMKVRGRHAPNFPIDHYLQLKKLNLDLFINHTYGSGLKCPAKQGIFMCMFPHEIRSANFLPSYEHVIAISQFSAEWVRKLWKRDAEIIYPPCDDMGPPGKKAKIILHVGRFVSGDHQDGRHQKGQMQMLSVFQQLAALHKDGWELHFVGSVGGDERSTKFQRQMCEAAKGVPAFFHFNVERNKLRDLYRCASLYWHATGFQSADDEPGMQEHFGISTVEAMSAGAVPLVYGSGGQKEIVTDKVDGFWWADESELIRLTMDLARDASVREQMGQKSIDSSKRFGRQAFVDNIDQLIAKL